MRAIYLREVTIANRKFHTLRGRFYQDLDNRLLLKRNFSSYSFFFVPVILQMDAIHLFNGNGCLFIYLLMVYR